jgi:curved DNA-binding protein CbpA
MENNIDPYKVLGINKNFSIDELKNAYKKMALQVHPDKGGSEYLFKLVTLCYRTLSREFKKQHSDKQYHELKAEFTKTQHTNQSKQNIYMDSTINTNDFSKGFNIDKFNNLFEQNKIETVTDIGYGDFLKSTKEKEQKNIFATKKFSNDLFNKYFEKQADKNLETNKFVVKYTDPEPLSASKKIAYTELGIESIDDFSSDNTSRKNLNFMDLKIAHTTSRIVDPKNVNQRKEYRNIQEFENDRSKVSYTLEDKDKLHYEKLKKQKELIEKRRIENQIKIDNLSTQQFEKIHKLLLGKTPTNQGI